MVPSVSSSVLLGNASLPGNDTSSSHERYCALKGLFLRKQNYPKKSVLCHIEIDVLRSRGDYHARNKHAHHIGMRRCYGGPAK